MADTVSSLRMQVEQLAPEGTREEYFTFCRDVLHNTDSSTRSSLDTLKGCGLIHQVDVNVFAITPVAAAWLESGEPLDLIRIIHSHIRPFGELLPLLNERRTFGDLRRQLTDLHHTVLTESSVRSRLQLLRDCDLVRQPTNTTYEATARGLAFAKLIPLETPARASERERAASEDDHAPAEIELVNELRAAARDIRQPARFERVISEAFAILGFTAANLGGPGKTDILATVRTSPTTLTTIIVDAKATAHDSVQESAIDFTTLQEHRERHQADHVVLVGIGFDAGRIVRRARDHGVSLLTVESLIMALKRHQTEPIAALDLLPLMDATSLVNPWEASERKSAIIAAAIAAVEEEAELLDHDETFTVKDIFKTLRRTLVPPPSMDEVATLLELLASPLIGGVISTGKGSYAPGLPAEAVASHLLTASRAARSALVGA